MRHFAAGPVQLAYAVTDVRAAATWWAEHLGAGPFVVRDHIPVTNVRVGGEPGRFDHSSAYGQWGAVMVELVAEHSPRVGAASGLHHVAYFVNDLRAALSECAARGWPEALYAEAGQPFAFADARHELGHLVEMYEPVPRLVAFYGHVAAAARGWDGCDPFIPATR